MTSPSRVRWPWARWSLARQLPLITAAVVVIVMVLSLTLTYRALVKERADSLRARIHGLLGVLVQTGEINVRARLTLLHQLGRDTLLTRVASAAPGSKDSPREDSAVVAVLQKIAVPADSGLPVELWTADGRRVAHIGVDVRGDSIGALPPELRSRRGSRVSEVPAAGASDTAVQFGALYPSGNHVFFWTVAPVIRDGRRVGSIVQQRRIVSNPAVKQMIRDLSGEEFTVFLRNATDPFWASVDGHPVPPPVRRDTTDSGYVATRPPGEPQIGAERRVRGTPYLYVLEAPRSAMIAEPRKTLRQLALLSVLLLVGGVLVSWLLARRITRPLVDLTRAAEDIAQGHYGRRVATHSASDEVERLGTSFNRMVTEVGASQRELASQVDAALRASQQLEGANEQLQQASTVASEARDAALQANRAKSDFLAVMSHELRTPLNAIGGYTEILQLGIYGAVTNQQRDALQRIERSQHTLLSLINDVLNFAKLESGEVRYAMTDVLLGTMLSTIDDFVAPQLRDRHIGYSVEPCDAEVTVHADVEKLQQILVNLLSNAVKYTPEGGRIDVRCETSADSVLVHVHDTGIGIAEDRLDRIFDPFIQVGRALNRPHDGVGLGLSISRDLATAMGGSLSVKSALGEGSTFTLSLPRSGPPTV